MSLFFYHRIYSIQASIISLSKDQKTNFNFILKRKRESKLIEIAKDHRNWYHIYIKRERKKQEWWKRKKGLKQGQLTMQQRQKNNITH